MANQLIWIIIVLAVLAGFAWFAKWIIEGFFPEPMRTPALILVGVVLLIFLIIAASQLLGGGSTIGPFKFGRAAVIEEPSGHTHLTACCIKPHRRDMAAI